ncbi:hypothetical protein [Oryza sativa Japonica Group]|uniref:Uncharacterized protein P0416D03.16 n=1 Tax=Oryza sativa subsp. japonica TaxID=39947 RepID=Q5ZDN5_ORYSJ|nr:hypothetical protein [Oryza sativa Japonica Group]
MATGNPWTGGISRAARATASINHRRKRDSTVSGDRGGDPIRRRCRGGGGAADLTGKWSREISMAVAAAAGGNARTKVMDMIRHKDTTADKANFQNYSASASAATASGVERRHHSAASRATQSPSATETVVVLLWGRQRWRN